MPNNSPDTDLRAQPLAEQAWWRNAVVYQVYPRSFADSNGDGIGDLRGIIGRLEYLEALGIDVIWLSPVYRSPQDDNGYDIADYQGIDPMFGTLGDLDELIADARRRGIRIVMDLVVNHTSDEHPWFIESRSSPNSAKRDWYWWRSARPGFNAGEAGAEPTNWGSAFSGSAWALDEASNEYFLHLYSPKQPDLNWENPAVRDAIYAMMRWWLERGIAGFRMDVINQISKRLDADGNLSDGPLRADGWGDGSPEFTDGPRIHEFVAEMRREVFEAFPDTFLTVGEMPGVTVEEARLYTAPERRELDMVFQFEHMNLDHGPAGKFDPKPLHLPDLKRSLARWQTELADRGWNALYWSNHDQPRIVSRWGDDRAHRVEAAKTLATVLHFHRGTPYIYQGEELGMPNADYTDLSQYRDLESLNYAADAAARGITAENIIRGLAVHSRDNARTGFPWDATRDGGFSAVVPWISPTPTWATINALHARSDERSVFHHYRQLIGLRHSDPLLIDGTFHLLAAEHPDLWAFTRSTARERFIVLANCSTSTLEVDTAAIELADTARPVSVVISSHSDPQASIDEAIVLRPWESIVYRQ